MSDGVQARASLSGLERCPYCHEQFARAGDTANERVTCAGCGTSQHASCYAEHGGCATHGCGRQDALRFALPTNATPPPSVARRSIASRLAGWGVLLLLSTLIPRDLVPLVGLGLLGAAALLGILKVLFMKSPPPAPPAPPTPMPRPLPRLPTEGA